MTNDKAIYKALDHVRVNGVGIKRGTFFTTISSEKEMYRQNGEQVRKLTSHEVAHVLEKGINILNIAERQEKHQENITPKPEAKVETPKQKAYVEVPKKESLASKIKSAVKGDKKYK